MKHFSDDSYDTLVAALVAIDETVADLDGLPESERLADIVEKLAAVVDELNAIINDEDL